MKRMYQATRYLSDVQESLYVPYKFSNCNLSSTSEKAWLGGGEWR